MFKAQGIIKELFQEQLIKDKYKSIEFVLEVQDGDYLRNIGIEFFGDKVEKLNGYKAGEEVEVSFNIDGRVWNNKIFNNVRGWRIQKIKAGSTPEVKVLPTPPQENEDDLPF